MCRQRDARRGDDDRRQRGDGRLLSRDADADPRHPLRPRVRKPLALGLPGSEVAHGGDQTCGRRRHRGHDADGGRARHAQLSGPRPVAHAAGDVYRHRRDDTQRRERLRHLPPASREPPPALLQPPRRRLRHVRQPGRRQGRRERPDPPRDGGSRLAAPEDAGGPREALAGEDGSPRRRGRTVGPPDRSAGRCRAGSDHWRRQHASHGRRQHASERYCGKP